MTDNHQPTLPSKKVRHEGPRNHNLSYIVSILLTMLSFAVVLYGELDPTFVLVFIIFLAFVQAIFQLFFWMHAKDKGHAHALLALGFGFVVALTALVTAVYWVWI